MGLKEKVLVTAGLVGGVTILYYFYTSGDFDPKESLNTKKGSDLDLKLQEELDNLSLLMPIENISFPDMLRLYRVIEKHSLLCENLALFELIDQRREAQNGQNFDLWEQIQGQIIYKEYKNGIYEDVMKNIANYYKTSLENIIEMQNNYLKVPENEK